MQALRSPCSQSRWKPIISASTASCARAGEGQQLLVDEFAHRSFHGQVKQKAGRQPLSALKLMKSDPAAVLAEGEDIKARYAKLFRV